MSNKGSSISFASRGRFDLLDVEDTAEEEQVEEPSAEKTPSETPEQPSTLSKSARKKLAKAAAAKASETATSTSETVGQTAKSAADKLPVEKKEVDSAVAEVKEMGTNKSEEAKKLASKTTEKAKRAVDSAPPKVAQAAGDFQGTAVEVAKGLADEAEDLVNGATETATQLASDVSRKASEAVNGKKASDVAATVKNSATQVIEQISSRTSEVVNGDTVESAKDGAKKASEKVIEEVKNAPVVAKSIVNGTLDSLPSINTEPLQKALKSVPQSSFSPSLPESLPTPSSTALPSNRKRKTPTDFTPSGSGALTKTPASPSKVGVKFEDGIAPGEGLEGETIINAKNAILKKDRNVVERTVWTFIMIAAFITLLCLGHPYMILTVLLCQTLVYKEVTALFDLRDEGTKQLGPEQGDRWSKTLNWYFFVVTNYFLYGESIIYYFKHIVFVDAYFIGFARNHRFISFMLYVVGFVGFVANLQRQYLRQQFALFCWVHISLLLIVVSSHFIVNNILEGHIWFFVPASLVICNDVMAYVCGKLFGKTPLIKLSPKKTVEGFVGAFICTLIFGLAWGTFFMRFPYMICPARDLGTTVWSNVQCRPNPVFIWREFQFTGAGRRLLEAILGRAPPTIPYAPFQLHVLVMATFASLVAPFGGFFASGFKRAFNIKDFGHSIPGHGGMTDRMDCQFMMGLFSYVYYSSLIRIQYVTVGSVMQTVVMSLSTGEQLELLSDLRRFLEGQGIKA